MSKAVKSDGKVNSAVRTMCGQGLKGHGREKVDQYLRNHDLLKQCELGTLCLAMDEYEQAFGEKNWDVFYHATIKARQSSVWRDYSDKKKVAQMAAEIGEDAENDPFAILDQKLKGG